MKRLIITIRGVDFTLRQVGTVKLTVKKVSPRSALYSQGAGNYAGFRFRYAYHSMCDFRYVATATVNGCDFPVMKSRTLPDVVIMPDLITDRVKLFTFEPIL